MSLGNINQRTWIIGGKIVWGAKRNGERETDEEMEDLLKQGQNNKTFLCTVKLCVYVLR